MFTIVSFSFSCKSKQVVLYECTNTRFETEPKGSEQLLNEQLKKKWQFSSAIERLDRDP